MTRILRSYQQTAATYLYEHDGAFLIAPLGAGKSTAALTAAKELIRDGHRRHALVVAPRLVATTVWPQEPELWDHLQGLSIAVLEGTPRKRGKRLADSRSRNMTVVGIDLVQWLCEALAGYPDDHPVFDILIIDETSKLKDPTGKRARALAQIAPRFKTRWGLTGTPRPNGSMDLFAPASIITAGRLWGRAFTPWRAKHFVPDPRDPFRQKWLPKGLESEQAIATDFATVAMTVRDEDMPDLPPLNTIVTAVRLPARAMAVHDEMWRKLRATIEDTLRQGLRGIEAASSMVATGKCAQIANGFLYTDGVTGNGAADPSTTPEALGARDAPAAQRIHEVKIDWLGELIEALAGQPLLIAYEFVEDLRRIRQEFGDIPALTGLAGARAQALVDAWNAGQVPLLAFHPAAAGHGINLQLGGAHMAWISPSWSAELTEQAIARIYRPGQTRKVTIHVCVAAGTVDDMKRARVIDKVSAQEAFRQHLEKSHAATDRIPAGDAP